MLYQSQDAFRTAVLVDGGRWSEDISCDDGRAATEQLRWLNMAVGALTLAAESDLGPEPSR